MKRYIYSLLALTLLFCVCGCGTSNRAATGDTGTGGAAATEDTLSVKDSPGVLSNSSSVERIMNYLGSDGLMGREAGTLGSEMAALFIEDQFRLNRVSPFFESYRDTLSNFEGVAFNVVGWVEGQDPVLKNEFILIGAHYDHIGVVPAQSMDSIANGANDNASGTATVLELARYFGNSKTNGRSLIFALFSAEEKGLLGSFHLAKKLKQQGLPLYLMLNFEMTGVPLQDKDYLAYVTGYGMSNLADVMNRHAGEKVVGFLPSAEQFNLFQRSDNYPFHLEFGIPSQTFCTFDFTNFDHYHKVGDEVQLMDMDHMSELVNTFIPIVEKISRTVEREITY